MLGLTPQVQPCCAIASDVAAVVWRMGTHILRGFSVAGIGTLLVKDNSHAAHERFFASASVLSREEQAGVRDFYKLRPAELPFWDGFRSLPLAGAAGSLFLWDSRTIHAVRAPTSD